MSFPLFPVSARRRNGSFLARLCDRRAAKKRSPRQPLRIETLESRQMLTVEVFGGGTDFQINATSGAQDMTIDLDASDRYTMTLSSGGPFTIVSDPSSHITVDSANQISFDASAFESLFMDFGLGNDTVRFESDNNGYPNAMDISGGTGSDTLINNVVGGGVFDHELRINIFETITLNEDLDVTRGSTPIDDDRSTALFIDQNPFNDDPITITLAEDVDIRTHDGDFNPSSAVTMVLEGAGGTNHIISAAGEVNNTAGTFDPRVFVPTTTGSGNAGLDVRSSGGIFLPGGGIDIDGPFLAAYDTDNDEILSVSASSPLDAPQITLTGSGADDSLTLGSAVSSGDITLNDWQSVNIDSPLDVEIKGTTPGSEYTQLKVEGEVDISGTTLGVNLDFATSIGDLFVIIDNDAADAVVGTFAGLAEGATIVVGTAEFTISYQGGSDSNDVVLTTTVPPTVTTIDIVAGRLVIEDVVTGGKDDTLTIARDGDDLVFSDPNNVLGASVGTQVDPNMVRVPIALITSGEIDINAGQGDDNLTVDLTATAIGMPINYDGGADGDLITLVGSATNVTHSFIDMTSGGIVADSTTITYTGLEPIIDNLIATNRVFTFTGGAETITLSDDAGTPNNSMIVSTLGESVSFTNPTAMLTINAGSGDDTIDIDGIDSAFGAAFNVDGDGDDDTINYKIASSITMSNLELTASAIVLMTSGINTTGPQLYNGDVTLSVSNVSISAGTGTVDFTGTINGTSSLLVTTSGTTTFGGAVGNSTPLVSLQTNGGGTTEINGGGISTSGDQTYDDDVELGIFATLTSSGNVSFNSTIDGPGGLVVNAAGITTFGDVVGGTTPLASLQTNGGGTTEINGGSVETIGDQTYDDAVELGVFATLTSSGNVSFNSTVDGPGGLVVDAAGITTFGDVVGGTTSLASLQTNGGGTTEINGGSVETIGDQTYDDAVELGVFATLTSSGNVSFNSTVDGPGGLVVNASGTTTFGGVVGGTTPLASLQTNGGGTTEINGGSIETIGDQTYDDAVELGVFATLTSSGNVSFNSTVDGPGGLVVNASGTTTFGGVVGGTTPLASLQTNGGGTTAINGGSVTTSGDQTYDDGVTLGMATTITAGGNVSFNSTIDGAVGLTVSSTGITTFGGVVGGTTPLAALTVTTAGPFVLQHNMTITDDIDFTVVEGVPASEDDDLRIESSATIRTTAGNVTADVGDDVTIEAGSTLRAGTSGQAITIHGDAGSNDTDGSTITVGGPVFATNVVLNGDAQADTIDVRVTLATSTTTINGMAGDDAITIGSAINSLDSFAGPIVVTGNANDSAVPGDVLNLNDDGDNDVENEYLITSTMVSRNGMALLTYSTIEALKLNVGMKDNLIVVVLPDVSLEEDLGTETALPGLVQVTGNGGRDTLKYMGSDDKDTLDIGNANAASTAQHQIAAVECLLILMGAGNDVVDNDTSVSSVMDLGEGSDIAFGGEGVDVIYGGMGTEINIDARGGDDFVLPDHDIMGVQLISSGDGNSVGNVIDGGAGFDAGVFLTNGVPDKIAGFESGVFDGALIDDVIMWLTAQFLPATEIGGILANAATAKCANWHSHYVGTNLPPISSQSQSLAAIDPSADDVWYDFVTDSDGILSAHGLFDPAGGDVMLTLFDENFGPLASDYSAGGSVLVTHDVAAGQKMYLRVRGVNDKVDVAISVGTPVAGPSVTTVVAGQANSALSYAMPSGSGAQINNLPWAIDQLSIQFDQQVDIDAGAITITNADGEPVALLSGPTGFSYDPTTYTATWTLASPVKNAQLTLMLDDSVQGIFGTALDGEWTNPAYLDDPATSVFPSGNGTSGGSFEFSVNVLAGDVNQDGAVTIFDVLQTSQAMAISPAARVADMNGDAVIDRSDLVQVIQRYFENIGKPSGVLPSAQAPAALITPVGQGSSASAAASTVDAVFSSADDRELVPRRVVSRVRRANTGESAPRRALRQAIVDRAVGADTAERSDVRLLRARRTSRSLRMRMAEGLAEGDTVTDR